MEKSEFRYSNVYSHVMEVEIYESNLPSENKILFSKICHQ